MVSSVMRIQGASTSRGTAMVRGHPMTISLVTLTKRVGARMALRQGGNLMPQDLAVDCSILWVDRGLPGFGYSKGASPSFS